MFTRKVLVVDDDKDIKNTIDTYKSIYRKIAKIKEEWKDYSLDYTYVNTIKEAIGLLEEKKEIYDIILVDYDFPSETSSFEKGVELVKKIRAHINRRCKIIFYTMSRLKDFSPRELVDLINNDVFRFVSKSGEIGTLKYPSLGPTSDQLIVEALFDALIDMDPVVMALERYFTKFKATRSNMRIEIEGKQYTIGDILDSIKLDTEAGNIFINNIFKIAVLDCIKFLD